MDSSYFDSQQRVEAKEFTDHIVAEFSEWIRGTWHTLFRLGRLNVAMPATVACCRVCHCEPFRFLSSTSSPTYHTTSVEDD